MPLFPIQMAKSWAGYDPFSDESTGSAAPGTFMPSLHTFLQGRQAHIRLVVSKARLGNTEGQHLWDHLRYHGNIMGIVGQTTIHNCHSSTIWKTKFGVKHGKTTNNYVCLKMENTHSYTKIG